MKRAVPVVLVVVMLAGAVAVGWWLLGRSDTPAGHAIDDGEHAGAVDAGAAPVTPEQAARQCQAELYRLRDERRVVDRRMEWMQTAADARRRIADDAEKLGTVAPETIAERRREAVEWDERLAAERLKMVEIDRRMTTVQADCDRAAAR